MLSWGVGIGLELVPEAPLVVTVVVVVLVVTSAEVVVVVTTKSSIIHPLALVLVFGVMSVTDL
jgi:hypothetical protein